MNKNKIDENLQKVIKQLSTKQKNSREFKKYKKILNKKIIDIMHYKKNRTRDQSMKYFNEFHNENNKIKIPKLNKNLMKI